MQPRKPTNKRMLKFYTDAFEYFNQFSRKKEFLDEKYDGLCSFVDNKLLCKIDENSYRNIKLDIRQAVTIATDKSQKSYSAYFPNNGYRLTYIKRNIAKYQKLVDKQ